MVNATFGKYKNEISDFRQQTFLSPVMARANIVIVITVVTKQNPCFACSRAEYT